MSRKTNRLAPLGTRPDGTAWGVPLIELEGNAPGPTLGIIAGIHGDEFEGPETVRRLLLELHSADLRGTIIATPQANLSAFETYSRGNLIDALDLNRSFPGNADAFFTQRIADVLVHEIVERADYLIDLHSGGLAYALTPYVGFNSALDDTGRQSFTLAKVFGFPLLYASTPFPNVLRLEAAKRHIPAILVEAGGEGRLKEDMAEAMRRGVQNVLRHLGMLNGELEQLPEEYTIVRAPAGGEFRHFPTGGFVRNYAQVGSRVRQGELLASIVNLYGLELTHIEAHVSGIILEMRTIPVARTGDWSYAIAEVIGSAKFDTALDVALRGNS